MTEVANEAGLLTYAEHEAIAMTAKLWNLLCEITDHDSTRASDLSELAAHVHAIQHAIMAQAASREHPALYRALGGRL